MHRGNAVDKLEVHSAAELTKALVSLGEAFMISRRQFLGSLALAAAPLQLASAQGVAHLDKLWDVIIIGSGFSRPIRGGIRKKKTELKRVLVIEKDSLYWEDTLSSPAALLCLPPYKC